MRFLLALAVLLAVFLPHAFAAEDAANVISTPEGVTILRPFKNAEYPHKSRADVYTLNGKSFDAATHYSDSTVGIFIPSGYKQGGSVDFVVHFHGWSNHVEKVFTDYDLRTQFVKSGVNAILLVPQGPKDATDSGGGHLELDGGGFAALLREVAQYLADTGRTHTTKIGRIVLSTHSGGYKVTSAILVHGGLTDRITDVLLFDSSYGNLEGFADWVKSGRNRRLISIFTEHLASANAQLMALLEARKSPFHVTMNTDLTDSLLLPRHTLFIHTLDLLHNDVIAKKDYLAWFLKTSALSGK